jgi:DNA polymerase-3 subunit delta'
MDPWALVIGQEAAVGALRAAAVSPVHAYLLVGPRGSGKRAAARAFAAEILGAGLDEAARERVARLCVDEQHVDFVVIEPDGNIFRGTSDRQQGTSPGQRLLQEAVTSPREADRKVVVAVDFHLANDVAIGRLLKIIEEPPESTVLVILEEDVPPEQATIESRCVRIDFGAVPLAAVTAHLRDHLDIEPDRAALLAMVAGGDVARAEGLATDANVQRRYDTWRGVPDRLDGTGSAVVAIVAELQGLLTEAEQHLEQAQEAELEEIDRQAEARGTTRGSGRKDAVERHKRARRRARGDELRFGLATLAEPYRLRLATGEHPLELRASLDAIQAAAEALERNPIEDLLLEALLLRLQPPR